MGSVLIRLSVYDSRRGEGECGRESGGNGEVKTVREKGKLLKGTDLDLCAVEVGKGCRPEEAGR